MPLLLRSARRLAAALLEKVVAEQGLLEAEFRGCLLYCFCFCSRMRIAKKAPALIASGLGKRLR